MKTITIGRETGCNIQLNDEKCSRRHALLRISNTGKTEIVDLSTNGTFVNGMRIPSNKPYPITRKDVVTFAHAEKLDWKQVADPTKVIMWFILSFFTLLVVVIGIIVAVNKCSSDYASSGYGSEFDGASSSDTQMYTPKKDAKDIQKTEKKTNKFGKELRSEKKAEKKKAVKTEDEVKTEDPNPNPSPEQIKENQKAEDYIQ